MRKSLGLFTKTAFECKIYGVSLYDRTEDTMSKKSQEKKAAKAAKRTTLSGFMTSMAVFGIVALAVVAAIVSLKNEFEEAAEEA